MPKIGQVGLGAVGHHYAVHLLKAFSHINVYDTDPKRATRLKKLGARPQDSARAVGKASEVVVLALPSPEAVESVVAGPEGVLAGAGPGAIILDLSTVGPDTCVKMYQAAKERGVSYLEAPISGGAPGGPGTEGAKKASVTFMIGGDKEAFEKARPVLQVLGKRYFYLGPAGSGSTVKLLSNQISGLINLVCAEAFVLGAAAGFDPETLLKVFYETDADSYFMKEYLAPRILKKDFEPGFTVDLMYKDHRLAGQLGQKLGVPLLFNELATQLYQMMRSQGLGQKDLVEAIRFWGQMSGADIYSLRKQ